MWNNKKKNSFWVLAIRKVALISITQLFLIPLFFYAQSASAVALKNYTEIEDNVIRLGDIFDGVPHSADRILGAAPLPGQDITLNARTLFRVALALDLDWKPKSGTDYVVIRRAGTIVDEQTVLSALENALKDNGAYGHFKINIPGEHIQVTLPTNQPANVEIADINFNSARKTFEATLFAPSKANPELNRRISGSIENLIRVPTLKSTLNKGDVIRAKDITYTDIPERFLKQDIITKAEHLTGTTPRRYLSPSEPIKANDIEYPKIVQRGEAITMIFKQGPLQLTARGKALENGAKGDLIRVVNTGSNQTIDAIITAEKEVTVQTY